MNQSVYYDLPPVRQGRVVSVAGQTCVVDLGGVETNGIRWLAMRAGSTIAWAPPSVGEQVLVCRTERESFTNGVVIGSLFTGAAAPGVLEEDTMTFADGTTITRAENHLTIEAAGAITVNAKEDVTVKTDGDATVEAANIKATATESATVESPSILLTDDGSGAGVVTNECICAFTGAPHADVSKVVMAGKEKK